MDLNNKRILILGDSITEGALATSIEKSFVGRLKNEYKLDVINYGVGGTRIARQRHHVYGCTMYDYDFNLRLTAMESEADIIIVFGGTNDYGHGDSSFYGDDEYSFEGALKILCAGIKKKYPTSRVLFLTPLQRIGVDRPIDHSLEEFASMIKNEALSNGFDVLDLYNDKDFIAGTKSFSEKISPDNLHPNDLGHEALASKIYKKLLSM